MAQALIHTLGKSVGSAAEQPPRRSVWYRPRQPDWALDAPPEWKIPGGWMTTSRWTAEDLLAEGFEVYSPELAQKLFPPQEI